MAAVGPRLIGVIPTRGGMDVDAGGCGVGCNLPRDKDDVMEDCDDELLFDDGRETCSNKFPRA